MKGGKKILQILIYGIIFLLPIFWLPFSFEFFEFNKIYLLFFLSLGGLLLWFLRGIISEKQIKINWQIQDNLILAFLFLLFLSSYFSQDKSASLFGTYGRFSDGFFAFLSLILFYFLLKNLLFEKIIFPETILRIFYFSGIFLLLWFVFALFLKKFPLFVTGGGLDGFSLYLVLIFLPLFSRALREKEKISQILLFVFVILAFGVLLILDSNFAWIIFVLGSLFLLFKFFTKEEFKENYQRLLLPLFFLLIALSFLFLESKNIFKIFNFQKEMVLDQKESWKIGFLTLSSSFKNIFLGSGPGTFFESFSKFRSEDFTKKFWQRKFDRAGNQLVEILTNFGILGFLIWLSFLAAILFSLKKSQLDIEWQIFLFSILILQFIFYGNATLNFLFFLGLALASQNFSFKERKFSLFQNPKTAFISESIFMIFIFLFGLSLFFGIKFYLADFYYKKAFFEPNLDKKIVFLQKSAKLNPYQSYYQMVMSQALLERVKVEVQKPREKQNFQILANLAKMIFDFGKRATQLSPGFPISWQNLGNLYRDTIGIIQGVEDWAEKSYNKAIELDPKNPILYLERGKIYSLKKDLEKAEKDFQMAKKLAPNFLQAHLQLALLEEKKQNLKKAVEILENLARVYPQQFSLNLDLLFNLGRLYYNEGKIDQAIFVLNKAILLQKDHSNSLYILALCYEKKGDFKKAKEFLEKVAKLNPENKMVKEKLQQIREKIQSEKKE